MNKTLQKIIVIISYLLAILFIIYFTTPNKKIGYFYQKNKPWKYNNLIAPFDFPVYKTQDEIKKEKDSILINFYPYLDEKVEIKNEVLENINSIINNFSSIRQADTSFIIDFYEYVNNIIDSLYNKGVIKNSDLQKIKSKDTVIIVSGNRLIEKPKNTLIYQKQAIKLCKNKIKEYIKKRYNAYSNITTYFNCNKIIKPNIFYNKDLSQQELKNALATISFTKGMIQKDELIIAHGEIVSPQKYQILESLKKEYELHKEAQHIPRTIAGYSIIFIILFLLYYLFVEYHFRDQSFVPHILFISLITLFAGIELFAIRYNLGVYSIPFALVPIIFRAFYKENFVFITIIASSLVFSLLSPFPFESVLYFTATGIVIVITLYNFTTRHYFIRASLFTFLVYSSLYLAFHFIQGNGFATLRYTRFIAFAVSSVLILLSYGLIYIIEKIFGIMSDISLVELSNTNKYLLQQLSEQAPGTFQHTIQVSNLAYDVAKSIKAKALLVKTGALYHDIGKMSNPEFFTENQFGKNNPHDNLSPEESAKIIVGHVAEGVKLAQKHKLPKLIIDFITTHHGTTCAYFFSEKYKKLNPGKEIDKKIFCYPGPKPFTKETAILMMCDAVEAASRSLDEYTSETISNLVDKIIDNQFRLGQFDNAPITLQDITIAKNTLKQKLQNIYHTRVKYPD